MLVSGITVYFFSTVTITNVTNRVGMQYIAEVENRVYDRVVNFTAPLSAIVEINRNAFSHQPHLLDDLSSQAGRLYEQAKPYPQMTFISVATIDGRYLASSQDPFGNAQLNIAANFVNKPLTMEGFKYDPVHFIGDKIQSDPIFSYDPRLRSFYQDAVNSGGTVWSKINPYYGIPILGVGLSSPIYNQEGQLLGVTATSIALIELDRYLESIELVDNAYIFLAEEDGALIATSSCDELCAINDEKPMRVNLVTHNNKILQMAGKMLKSGVHSFKVDGADFIYRVRPINLALGKTWLIGVIVPTSHHRSLLTEYTRSTVIITLLLFVCIALLGSIIAWYIGKPIQQLSKAANDSNLGSIKKLPQPLGRIREINSLSRGLQLKADKLFDIMLNLERKVAQRTSYLEDANDTLLERSLMDELTNVYNRRGFNQVFEQAFNTAIEKQKSLTLIICDIDYFKRVNDQFGHPSGDLALVAVAKVLKQHLRAQDIVARYGGEEFALVIMGVNIEQVRFRLNKIRQSFCINPVFDAQHITMSFGVAHYLDVASTTIDNMIHVADKNLYRAKNTGRDKIVS